jgi:hypothetical protein
MFLIFLLSASYSLAVNRNLEIAHVQGVRSPVSLWCLRVWSFQ